MSDGSRIEWTEATWNPVTGCHKVSQGCKHCYAERDWRRLAANPLQPKYHGRAFTDVQCHPDRLQVPLRWIRGRRIFVNSMSDLFHEAVPFEFIDKVFAVMACTTRHTYQVLTKRPRRMLEYFESRCAGDEFELRGWPPLIDPLAVWPQWVPCRPGQPGYDNCGPAWPLVNVWIGVSVEDQATADERIPALLDVRAAVRFLSCEPLLAPIDIRACLPSHPGVPWHGVRGWNDGPLISWVIAGGESGPEARPTHPAWVRDLRDQCLAARTPFFFKQWGEWLPVAIDVTVDGRLVYPLDDAIELPDGRRFKTMELDHVDFARVGKKAAGRILDGRTHDGYPAAE